MSDIWIAVAVMSCLCLAAGMVAMRYLSSEKGQRVVVMLTLSLVAMMLFLLHLAGHLFWARIIPHSAAIIYTNLSAVFAALATGWAWRMPNTPAWRRGLLSAGLALASLAAILWPLLSITLRPPPEGGDKWEGLLALQSSWATCSPAAAATLLNAEGIRTSEREMIPLCLTDYAGTPTLGLYRGIKLVADQHNRQVEIVEPSLETLLSDDDWPVLMACRLPFGVEDSRFEAQHGWIPGMGHSVVALGRTPDGHLLIGDPAIGLEAWSREKLEIVWQGNGIRLK
jgi:hypothetical protein